MLGLRLDEPVAIVGRRRRASTATRWRASSSSGSSSGPRTAGRGAPPHARGRFLGGGVTAELLARCCQDWRSAAAARTGRPRLPSEEDAAHPTQARDPAPRHRGVRRHGPAGRLAGARRALGAGRLAVDRSRRARGARGARPPDAPAHLRRPDADRERLSDLRGGARGRRSKGGRTSSASTCARCATRSSRRCARRPRCSRTRRGSSRSSRRRRSRPRRSVTSRSSRSSRRASWSSSSRRRVA